MSAGLLETVRADHALLRSSQLRYDERRSGGDGRPETPGTSATETSSTISIGVDLVRNIGFQQLAVFRIAAALHRRRLTPLAMLASRFIRHTYGAEMHYAADIAPGVLLVHGNGLVISRAARVERGCVLSQNVTLGISAGAVSSTGARTSGAPHLHRNVHVGPGAVIIGPVDIGAGCKVAPNTTVSQSMPPATVAEAAPTLYRSRGTTPTNPCEPSG